MKTIVAINNNTCTVSFKYDSSNDIISIQEKVSKSTLGCKVGNITKKTA